MRVFLLALLASVALVACNTTPFGVVADVETERRIGEELTPAFLASNGGIYEDARIDAYLTGIADRLSAGADLDAAYLPVTVRVLDTNEPNAYATPGGTIYLSRGMIGLADGEAELAAAIAHEIGHVEARHIVKRIARVERLVRNAANQARSDLQSGSSRTRRLAVITAAVQERLGEIGGFSREQELEADGISQRLLVGAGYDPSALAALLARLDAARKLAVARLGADLDALTEGGVSLYPALAERVAALGARGVAEADPAGRGRLLDLVDGMPFDDLYSGGYIREGSYWNPALGLAFDVPERMLPVHGEALQLVSPEGIVVLRIDAGDLDALEAVMREGAAFRAVRRIDIAGTPAVSARFAEGEIEGPVTAYGTGGKVASLLALPAPGRGAEMEALHRDMADSLRRVPASAMPGRRAYAVRALGTSETLADVAALAPDMEARLRLLNGLGPVEEAQTGERLKLVE